MLPCGLVGFIPNKNSILGANKQNVNDL